MKKNRYKDQNKKNYKKRIIVLFVMIFILLLALGILGILEKRNNEKNIEIPYEKISTIKEVIEYYKSIYIFEEKSTEKSIYLDVYVEFLKPLYEDNEKSNEKYFNELLKDCAKVLRYRSFNLIDKKNEINIKVICNNGKIKTVIINGIEDYFIYTDSQISMKNYKEIETIPIEVNSEILQNCINNNWNKDVYFGERDSIYDEYYIYFDEGIKVRIIKGKIYNIVFTKSYNKTVVNNCFPGIDFDYVKTVLGTPTFENEEKNIVGYKGEKFYVFFTDDEISIYRNSTIEADDFFKLADEFISQKIDLLEFMNELTYIWPDYSEYTYNNTSIYISYPLKGVEITLNNGDINGILVYNNIKSSLSKITRYLENTNFVSKLQIDLVFEAEKCRLREENELLKKCEEYKNTLSQEEKNLIRKSMKYEIYPEKDDRGYIYKMNFISSFGDNPNREVSDGITSFLWLTNDYFLFSKKGKGIYFYNLNNGKVQRIITGDDDFILKKYENGILKYDNKEIELQF